MITIKAPAFYNLARPPKSGNCSQVISSLLYGADGTSCKNCTVDTIDSLIDVGNFSDAETVLKSGTDHSAYVEQRSHDMLTYYIAGYVAQKILKTTQCKTCASRLAVDKSAATESDDASLFTANFDYGGLTYPSGPLKTAVTMLEVSFTTYFSISKVHEKGMLDFAAFLGKTDLPLLGCDEHAACITKSMMKFYIFLRFCFYTKSLNSERETKRQRMKLLKMRRCN